MLALNAFHRAFDFSGRSSRDEFLSFFGAILVIVVIISVMAGERLGAALFPAVLLGLAICAVPALSLTFRRLHDLNRQPKPLGVALLLYAANQLLQKFHASVQFTAIGPIIQWLVWGTGIAMFGAVGYVIYLCCQRGDEGANDYGPPSTSGADPNPLPTDPSFDVPTISDPLSQIERLSKLREAGTITEEEFVEQKAALLKRL